MYACAVEIVSARDAVDYAPANSNVSVLAKAHG